MSIYAYLISTPYSEKFIDCTDYAPDVATAINNSGVAHCVNDSSTWKNFLHAKRCYLAGVILNIAGTVRLVLIFFHPLAFRLLTRSKITPFSLQLLLLGLLSWLFHLSPVRVQNVGTKRDFVRSDSELVRLFSLFFSSSPPSLPCPSP